MTVPPAPTVLILSADPIVSQRWANALRAGGINVWCNWLEVPPEQEVEVLLTDGSLAETALAASSVISAARSAPSAAGSATSQPDAASGAPAPIGNEPANDDTRASVGDAPATIGIVAIGTQRVADAQLPADASPRELALACRLVAEIVRLRRQQHRHATLHQTLARLAMSDPLTSLPNRRAWDERLTANVEEAAARRQALCLVLFDVDYFKQINDTRGHTVGDAVLRASADVLRDQLRPDDLVARLGGDEFGVLLPGLAAEHAAAVVERIRASASGRLSKSAGSPMTLSAGFALLGGANTSGEALYAAADAALHAAKRAGRNCSRGAD